MDGGRVTPMDNSPNGSQRAEDSLRCIRPHLVDKQFVLSRIFGRARVFKAGFTPETSVTL